MCLHEQRACSAPGRWWICEAPFHSMSAVCPQTTCRHLSVWGCGHAQKCEHATISAHTCRASVQRVTTNCDDCRTSMRRACARLGAPCAHLLCRSMRRYVIAAQTWKPNNLSCILMPVNFCGDLALTLPQTCNNPHTRTAARFSAAASRHLTRTCRARQRAW